MAPTASALENDPGIGKRALIEASELWWQLRRPHAVRLGGVLLPLDRSWASVEIRKAIFAGVYEADERAVLHRTLKPGMRYMELGAGAGFVMTTAAELVGGENVFAYEANPQMVEVAERTATLNGVRPTLTNAILGKTDGVTDFFVYNQFWASSTVEHHPGGRPVQVPTRSFAQELERVAPQYLMIDIEGGEVELLDGVPLPACVERVCLEVHPHMVGADAINQTLMGLMTQGFQLDLELSGRSIAYLCR